MRELESSLHLFQPPLYAGENGEWNSSYVEALSGCGKSISWDSAAVLSVLSFNYSCGNRTLIKQVKRSPWLSEIGDDGNVSLKQIPPHGRLKKWPKEIASTFESLLCREAIKACQGYKEIYVLLSGGLDSRIVAGILVKLFNEGQLKVKPVGVTWGLDNSRDVVYGREVARILGMEWQHIDIGPDTIDANIDVVSETLGCLVPPTHLHCMQWFKKVSKEALVIGGSYGDSIGRGEFSGRNLIELQPLKPGNPFGLLAGQVLDSAYNGIMCDIKSLHDRTPGAPSHVLYEYEMQGFYMRGMIAHVMCVINQYCKLYQMFTASEVYSYIWSIHPVCRDNSVYAQLLENLNPRLARLPWARTNKALKGKTLGAKSKPVKSFHDYAKWITRDIYPRYQEYSDPGWFAGTGLFDPDSIVSLKKRIADNSTDLKLHGIRPYEIFTWLVSFRRFSDYLTNLGHSVLPEEGGISKVPVNTVPKDHRSKIRRILSSSKTLYALNMKIRRQVLKRKFLKEYPLD